MTVSIVIPNYNGADFIAKIIAVIRPIKGIDEIIIIDDCSTDNSVKIIKKEISKTKIYSDKTKIKLFQNEKNYGFSTSVNKGVKYSTGELIVLLNTDTEPKSDFLSFAEPVFKDPSVFAVGMLQQCRENGTIINRGRGVGFFRKGFLMHERGDTDKKNTLW